MSSPMALSFLRRRRPSPHSLLPHFLLSTSSPTDRLLSSTSSSSSSSSSTATSSSCTDPSSSPSSLSSRMSSVLDYLDSLHRDLHDRDEALRRIRAWRHSNLQPQPQSQSQPHRHPQLQHQHQPQPQPQPHPSPLPEHQQPMPTLSTEVNKDGEEGGAEDECPKKQIELAHPWPEWVDLLDRLLHQNYFDRATFLEETSDLDTPDAVVGSVDLTRDWTAVSAAIDNFGKDRFDILRSLSRKDIGILVGHGCPTSEGKVVYSAKLLRKHAHLDEGDVCSACSLRSNCKRGFLVLSKQDEARTLDVMRVLLTYAFHSINGSVKNESLMKMKSVKTIICKLLREISKLSAVPIDPNLPRPILKKAVPKVKQPPPPPKKRVGRDDVEMKKGDWLCPKCDFMNFAKNVVCLRCDAKRPKRQLLPGEWDCPQCHFLNYRRNMACFRCECKRPPDEYLESQVSTEHDPQSLRSKGLKITNVADAWNLNFDDHESDGAEVAAFEYADPSTVGRNSSYRGAPDGIQGFNDDFMEEYDEQRTYERGHLSESKKDPMRDPKMSFDDDEDDVDNYEIIQNGEEPDHISHKDLPEFEDVSKLDDFGTIDSHANADNNVRMPFSNSEDGMQDSDSDENYSGLSHWDSNKKGKYFPSKIYQELDSDSDDMGQNLSRSFRENSRRIPSKHHVIRDRTSECSMRQSRRESPADNVQNIRRPPQGKRFGYEHSRNDMVFGSDDFRGYGQKFQGEKTKRRPLRGKRLESECGKNDMDFDRDDSRGSGRRFHGGKPKTRPL